jgi:hypothetical protein
VRLTPCPSRTRREFKTVVLCRLKREMVLSTLRICADSTTIPPTRSDPSARCSKLNHSRAASADSTRRLFIPVATGDSFAGMMGSLASKLFVFINQEQKAEYSRRRAMTASMTRLEKGADFCGIQGSRFTDRGMR